MAQDPFLERVPIGLGFGFSRAAGQRLVNPLLMQFCGQRQLFNLFQNAKAGAHNFILIRVSALFDQFLNQILVVISPSYIHTAS